MFTSISVLHKNRLILMEGMKSPKSEKVAVLATRTNLSQTDSLNAIWNRLVWVASEVLRDN